MSVYRISIKALIFNEAKDKVLLCQEPSGIWELPGGAIEHGESVEDCLRREIREEMGLTIEHIDPIPRATFFGLFRSPRDGCAAYANIAYIVSLASLDFISSDECTAIRFFDVEDLSKVDTFPNVTSVLNTIFPRIKHP